MARTEGEDRKRLTRLVFGILAVGLIALTASRLMLPPQMGPDEEVFKTVDALFTALTSRDKQRLEDCEHRLRSYRDGGKLPAAAARKLDAIVKQAETGQWEKSAHQLYDFMLAQRRT